MDDAASNHRDPCPRVEIDLSTLCANFRAMADACPGSTASAVVKCDAYGLGAGPVARALALKEGCATFFVAYATEGAALRRDLAGAAPDAAIFVLNGPDPSSLPLFAAARLTPVLNSLAQADLWRRNATGPAALHIDTGMRRLGLPPADIDALLALGKLDLTHLMSHLARASDPPDPENSRQHREFIQAAARFPDSRLSFASSAGALTAPGYGFDMIRLGVGLYGVGPFDGPDPRILPVATLTGAVLQVQSVAGGAHVGYGGTFTTTRASRLATVALGYGDGYPRAGSNAGAAFLGGRLCPLAGRVSMDLISLDVTEADDIAVGDRAEFFGRRLAIEAAAAACGTIGYELLTRLSARVRRTYLWRGAPAPAEIAIGPR